MTDTFRALCAELLQGLDENRHPEVRYPGHLRIIMARARARLAQPEPPAEGEVGDEVLPPRVGHILRLAEIIRAVDGNHDKGAAALAEAILSHPGICSAGLAAEGEVAEQRHLEPVPPGFVPVEYWDIDSDARIVSEPAEEKSGGCWVVLNSRHVNPCTEFPTLEAAWKALQVAHALPLPAGEVGELADQIRQVALALEPDAFLLGVGWDRLYEKADGLLPANALPLPAGEVE